MFWKHNSVVCCLFVCLFVLFFFLWTNAIPWLVEWTGVRQTMFSFHSSAVQSQEGGSKACGPKKVTCHALGVCIEYKGQKECRCKHGYLGNGIDNCGGELWIQLRSGIQFEMKTALIFPALHDFVYGRETLAKAKANTASIESFFFTFLLYCSPLNRSPFFLAKNKLQPT